MISVFKDPDNLFAAFSLAVSVFASIISFIASAFDKSVFPFAKALKENSPPRACLKPEESNKENIAVTTFIPPWQMISAESSPVKLFGALYTFIKTSSIFFSF